ncbi:hypothetical protein Q9L58_000757 [Maublancomyces gigas]|uniref:Uncharacterized protein n=1 Tax=Discina gigas TaxID=1032678 RepID=A0ABR3GWA9_9PEZI
MSSTTTCTCDSSGSHEQLCLYCRVYSTPQTQSQDAYSSISAEDDICEDCSETIWVCKCFDIVSLMSESEIKAKTEVITKSENEGSVDDVADNMRHKEGSNTSQISLDPLDPYEPSGKSEGPRDTLRHWDKWNHPKTHIDIDDEDLVVLDHRR